LSIEKSGESQNKREINGIKVVLEFELVGNPPWTALPPQPSDTGNEHSRLEFEQSSESK